MNFLFFFFNDTATTEIYTLSLHDALPIYNKTVLIGDWPYMTAFDMSLRERNFDVLDALTRMTRLMVEGEIIQLSDRKSTRLNSSHLVISYAVFCLKKKNKR